MGKPSNTHKPVLENGNDDDKQVNDVVESLNQLYRRFQDEYCTNPHIGEVSVVSKSHIVCNGSKGKKTVSLAELYLLSSPEIQEVRTFVTLLPPSARFHIVHYPHSYDVFSIHWNNDAS